MVSLHVPLGITMAFLVMIFCFWFPSLCFSLGHGYEAKVELCRPGNTYTTTIRSSPEGMHEHMDEFNRLSEVPMSKPALFMNAKLVSSSSSLPQNPLKFPAYLLLCTRVVVHNTDFSCDL